MDAETVRPLEPRYLIEDLGSALRITTGVGPKSAGDSAVLVFMLLFGAIAIGMFSYIAFSMLSMLSPLNWRYTLWPTVFLLVMAVIFGVSLTYIILWRFTFKEVILVEADAITVSYQSAVFKNNKRYLAVYLRDLRASPIPPSALWVGTVAFDYGGRTLFFGSRLSEAEAKQIVAAIQAKFAQYKIR